jgi:sRNA-binding carbon storage regulator CsrA
MLVLTRKLQQSILLRMKGAGVRARFTIVDFKPQSIRIRWDPPPLTKAEEVTFDTGQPLSFLFAGRRVTVYLKKVALGQCRLEFDAPRDVLIDRAERIEVHHRGSA